MDFLYYPLGFVLLLGIVVTIHEFGHYVAARLVGVHVLRFSVGFGKALFGFHDKRGTHFTLSVIPLGGYVKLLGEDESESIAPVKECSGVPRRSFLDLSGWQKIFIAVLGPGANFLLSICVFSLISFSVPMNLLRFLKSTTRMNFYMNKLEFTFMRLWELTI